MPVVELPADAKLDAPVPSKASELPKDVPLDTENTPSFFEGVGAGILDKGYGAAQLAARVPMATPGAEFGAMPDLTTQPSTAEVSKVADEMVRKREQRLEKEGYNKGWGRTIGNMVGDMAITAPLALVPGGPVASLGAKVAQGAKFGTVGGVIAGATQPATGFDFAKEKAEQIGAAGLTGAATGGAFGALARAFAKDSPEAIDAFIKNTFRRNIKPTVAGKETASQVAREQQQAVEAIEAIRENKANLSFVDESGNVIRGETPETLDQFAQAIEQTKRPIYKAYDDLANASEFHLHAAEEAAASRAVTQRTSELTSALARQSQGRNVYQWSAGNRAVAEAQSRLTQAQEAARVASEKANATREILKRVQSVGGGQTYSSGKISTEPAIQSMLSVADTKAIQTVPAIRDSIIKTAENLRAVGEFSATEMQDYIQFLNSELRSYYGKANIPPGVAQAKALLAAKLRETLDETIEGVAGPGYQALKNRYGALKAIEANVVKRAQIAGREPVGGGIVDRLTNIASVEEAARALMTFDPTAIASAATLKGAQMVTRHLKSPNRAVKRLFEASERRLTAKPTPDISYSFTPPVLGGGMGGAAIDAMGMR